MLKKTYTIYADNCGYISHYSGDTYMVQDTQCSRTTFESLADTKDLYAKLIKSGEFDFTDLHIIQIDRCIIMP